MKQLKKIRKRKSSGINRTPKTYSFIGLRLLDMQLIGLWLCRQDGNEYWSTLASSVEDKPYLSDFAFERIFGEKQCKKST